MSDILSTVLVGFVGGAIGSVIYTSVGAVLRVYRHRRALRVQRVVDRLLGEPNHERLLIEELVRNGYIELRDTGRINDPS